MFAASLAGLRSRPRLRLEVSTVGRADRRCAWVMTPRLLTVHYEAVDAAELPEELITPTDARRRAGSGTDGVWLPSAQMKPWWPETWDHVEDEIRWTCARDAQGEWSEWTAVEREPGDETTRAGTDATIFVRVNEIQVRVVTGSAGAEWPEIVLLQGWAARNCLTTPLRRQKYTRQLC